MQNPPLFIYGYHLPEALKENLGVMGPLPTIWTDLEGIKKTPNETGKVPVEPFMI